MNMSVACSFLLPFHLHMRSFSFSVSLYSDDFLTVIGFQWFFFWENHFLLHFHWECRHSVIVITEHWIKCAYLVKLKHSFPLSNDNECDWLPNIKPYHLKRMATLGKFHWFLMNWRFFLLAPIFILPRAHIARKTETENRALIVKSKIVDKSSNSNTHTPTEFVWFKWVLNLQFAFRSLNV